MSLRVLVVTVVHDPEDARIRHRQLRALLAAGHAVTYAAPFTAYDRQPPEGVTPVDLPRAVGRRRAAAVRSARSAVRRLGPAHDVVLLHDPDLLAAVAGWRRPGGRPVVVWDVHEDTAAALGMRGWLPAPARPVAGVAVRAGEAWAERRVRLLLAEEGYAARFRRPHPVVPNSVLVPAAEPAPPGADRVVYLGRLTRARGALELVALGAALHRDDRPVTVELIGPADAEVADALRSADARGDVRWRGFLPNTRALAELEGALAGLSLLHDEPNYAHSRPTKVLEYMARGVPTVTTPNAASVELVRRHGCGLVVPFGDVPAAADAVRQLRGDASLRRTLAAAGRAAACAEHDWARDGRAFVEQLERWVAAAVPRQPA